MKKRKFSVLISGIIIGFFIAAVLIFLFLKQHNRETVNTLLNRADTALSSGYYNRADRFILLAGKKAKNSNEFISCLERAFALGKARNNYSIFLDVSKVAHRKMPWNKKISILFAFGMLKTKNISGAYNLLVNTTYKSFKLKELKESLLGQIAAQNPIYLYKIKDESNELIKILRSSYKSDPQKLLEIGNKYKSDALIMNASLIYAQLGDLNKAISTLSKDRSDSEFAYLMSLFAYDAGDYVRALKYLNIAIKNNPYSVDRYILKADILYIQNKFKESLDEYKKALKINPSFSWTPYYNTALIYDYLSDFNNSVKILNRSLSMFPEQPYTRLLLMEHYIYLRKPVIAEKILEGLENNFKDNPLVKLEVLKINAGSYPTARYYSELWELFNNNPDNKAITDYLVLYLLETGEFKNAEKALNTYIKINGGRADSWWHNYRAIIYAESGDYINAHKEFIKSISLVRHWYVYYNFAVLEEHEGIYREALTSLKNSENLIKNKDTYRSRNREISSIRYLTGRIYYKMGDTESARRELQYSIELNKDNLSSILLLKELEDTKK